MTIQHQVLGEPGRDNALYVEITTGQANHLLAFDCGYGCLDSLSFAKLRSIERLFFSHFHVDHVAGFDTFLRANYAREEGPVEIYGPAGAAEIIHHRLRGVTWNLVDGMPGEFVVHEITQEDIRSQRFYTREQFARAHPGETRPFDGMVADVPDYSVEARLLDHGTTSVGYCVREKSKQNVDVGAMTALGLRPGPWLKTVKDDSIDNAESVEIEGMRHAVGALRAKLLRDTPGESLAYLTDFQIDPDNADALLEMIQGCDVVVAENNFHNRDRDLAAGSRHLVSRDVGRLAARAGAKRLVLFHLSDRYTADEWLEQLGDVRAEFAAAEFPDTWSALFARELRSMSAFA